MNHWQGDENQCHIRRDVEDHLNNRVVVVCSAFGIMDRDCPVPAERSTEDSIVDDLDNNETNPDVDEQEVHSTQEVGQVTAGEC